MEVVNNDPVEGFEPLESSEKPITLWNGREVSIDPSGDLLHLLLSVSHPKDCPQLCSFRGKEPSFFDNYFDSEAKKQNKFDIAVYQHHIRCNSEESKKHLEKSFEMMATGMVGIVVGVARLLHNPVLGVFGIYNCSKGVWQGVEEFKKAMETSGIPLENVHFVTWYDDLERNTEELTKNSILEPWKPLDTSGFEIMDEQYKRTKLDPSLSNNIKDYA